MPLLLPIVASSLFSILLVAAIAPVPQQIEAAPPSQVLPSYRQAQKMVAKLWQESYPIPLSQLLPNPEKRGVLSLLQRGRRVYYYHFSALVARPQRETEGKIEFTGQRPIELWACYRNWRKNAWELRFVRQDRLPGKSRRWIRVK